VIIAQMKIITSLADKSLSAYDKRRDSMVTEQLNAVYGETQDPLDANLAKAQLAAIDETW
jgi:hypothetical protein